VIKRWLRRFPTLYVALQRAYYACRYAGERYLFGTALHELTWRWRGVRAFAAPSIEHPHRAFLLERARRFAPVESILEVGCDGGANLVLLAKAFPDAHLYGVDINARAITAAQAVLARAGVGEVTLGVGRAHDLRLFADRSVDLVMTDATLMYVGSDRIRQALHELVRVARKGLLLNEWHLFAAPGPAVQVHRWYDAHWVHDYERLLQEVAGVQAVSVEPLPAGLWGAGGWQEYGAIVEASVVSAST